MESVLSFSPVGFFGTNSDDQICLQMPPGGQFKGVPVISSLLSMIFNIVMKKLLASMHQLCVFLFYTVIILDL